MRLIVDASVAVKWFLREPLSTAARRLRRSRHALTVPAHFWAETAGALQRRQRRGDLGREDLEAILADLATLEIETTDVRPILMRAGELGSALDHRLWDCIYLAAAEDRGCAVATADRRLHDKVAASRHAGLSLWIEDVP